MRQLLYLIIICIFCSCSGPKNSLTSDIYARPQASWGDSIPEISHMHRTESKQVAMDMPCEMKLKPFVMHTKKKDGYFQLICFNRKCRATDALKKYKMKMREAMDDGSYVNHIDEEVAWNADEDSYNERVRKGMEELEALERAKPKEPKRFYAPLNKAIEFKNVYFDFDSTALLHRSFTEIDSLVNILAEYKDVKVIIVGHTDIIGSVEYNQTLSASRAEAVRQYIVSKGIPDIRTRSMGYGSSRPKYSNETEEGRARNRRVEFLLIRMGGK